MDRTFIAFYILATDRLGPGTRPPTPLLLDMFLVTWDDHSMLSPDKRQFVGKGLPRSASSLALASLLVAVSAGPATAQTSTSRRSVWDGAYTEAQAARGTTAFSQSCSGCHALTAEGKAPLVGEPFWKSFAQKNVGELLDFVSDNMPNGNPRSLNESTYRDVVALILKSNGFPAGTAELEHSTAAVVQIIPKDGRTELPANALARVVGCLTRSGADWVVTNATAPERAERLAPGEGDATRPLGSRSIALKFVLTRLDSLAGSRVAVNGLLIGDGGTDGINVTAVNRVAPKCP